MQQLWSYLWFRFTEITALGESAFKIFLSSGKELLRKSRVWFLGWLVDWLIDWLGFGGGSAFLSFTDQSAFTWGMSQDQCFCYIFCFEQALGYPLWKGVWGGWCYLPALALVSGKLPKWTSFLSAQLPRAFQILKILSIHWGKKVGRTRGEGDNPCARNPSWWGSQVQDRTLMQERSARSCLVCSFPQRSLFASAKYQTLHCLPACSPLHLLLLSEMCLQ